MSKNSALIWIVLLLAAAAGCAAPAKKIPEVTEEKLFQAYLRRGQEYEDKQNLVEAFKQYRLAMTVKPSDQAAVQNRNRVERTLRRSAEKHYKAGLKFHKAGKYRQARNQFLIALRLRPDYPEVLKMLATPKPVQAKRYVVHTIQPGESLSKVAMIYYGDYHKFSTIAKYNDIADATEVKVGQKIKVPEIDGVPFLARLHDIESEEVTAPDLVPLDQEAEKDERKEEPVDKAAMYRDHGIDLFNNKKYQEAIVEFNKVVNVNPDDAATLEYLYKSHFQQAMAFFQKEDYLFARNEFEASLRYKSDCDKCHEYARKSEELYKDVHYTQGISYFGKQLLAEAIREWELVQAIDPNYKRVGYNIDRAKTLLKKLEDIRKSRQEREVK